MAPKWCDYYGRLLSQAVEIHDNNFVAILHDVRFSEFARDGFDSDSLERAWGAMLIMGAGVVHSEDNHDAAHDLKEGAGVVHHDAAHDLKEGAAAHDLKEGAAAHDLKEGAGVVHSEDINHAAHDLKEERDDKLEELLMQSVEENGKGLQGFRKTLTQDKFKALHGWKATGLKTKYYSIINKRKAEAQKKSSDSNSKAANAEKKSEETKKVHELGSSNSDSSDSGSKAAKKAVKKAAKKAAAAAAKAAKKRYKNKDKAETVKKGKKKLGKGHDPHDPHGSSESSNSDSDGSDSYDPITSKADELIYHLIAMSKGLEALNKSVDIGFKNVIDAIVKNKAT